MVSHQFKEQINALVDKLTASNEAGELSATDYQEVADNFFTMISADNSIYKNVQRFSQIFSFIKIEVSWLDEVAEALKNTLTAFNSYIIFTKNLQPDLYEKITAIKSKLTKLIMEQMRQTCYTIGVITHRLINAEISEEY